ncbi:MAG: transposase [Firmicutes bacterium]|nr:transposase [Bacillota bacterium]
MGQAKRTTKVEINFADRTRGGANSGKREYLVLTKQILNDARAFYIDFFLAHSNKLEERVIYYSEKHKKFKERRLTSNELLTWAESLTVTTEDHPTPLEGWNFSEKFPGMPVVYRRSVIKDAIGKVRSYLSNYRNWEGSGKKKGSPGLPGSNNHPMLYKGTIKLELENFDRQDNFVSILVYDGRSWKWVNYPVKFSPWQKKRLTETSWDNKSPRLILREKTAGLHITQEKTVEAKKVGESKKNPDLITVGIDLNVKNLAVITVRKNGVIIKTVFVTDGGLDYHRYQHMKLVSKHQWLSRKPVKGEGSDKLLWGHVRRMNDYYAHMVSRRIVKICEDIRKAYPGAEIVILFERLRKIKAKGSKSCRLNRKQANLLKGKIIEFTRYKAYYLGIVTVEVNPHGTSQYCSRCGHKGERFSFVEGKRVKMKGGKLFFCPHCKYLVNADFNASVNVHHSFYGEFHWQSKKEAA